MGIYLLNISVDTADLQPENIPEDLSFNDQESLVEIMVEKVLGFEDAFKEYDDHDSKEQNKKKTANTDLAIHYFLEAINSQLGFDSKKQDICERAFCLAKGFYQLNTPPPKV